MHFIYFSLSIGLNLYAGSNSIKNPEAYFYSFEMFLLYFLSFVFAILFAIDLRKLGEN